MAYPGVLKTDEVFKDFLLSRISKLAGVRSRTSDQADATGTQTSCSRLGRIRTSPTTNAASIEMDYGMEAGHAKIVVRRALLFYALKTLGLDTDPAARKPQDQQIVLLNRDEVVG